MKLRKFLLWLSDIFWLKILGGNSVKEEYQKRCRTIIERVLSIIGQDEPYCIDGKWSWYKDQSGFHPSVTLVLIELPMVVHVLGPEIGNWDQCKLYCKNKESWEFSNKTVARLVEVTKQTGLPLILIGWNEPIDDISLSKRILSLLPNGDIEEQREQLRNRR